MAPGLHFHDRAGTILTGGITMNLFTHLTDLLNAATHLVALSGSMYAVFGHGRWLKALQGQVDGQELGK
jgi:hypothetical protein